MSVKMYLPTKNAEFSIITNENSTIYHIIMATNQFSCYKYDSPKFRLVSYIEGSRKPLSSMFKSKAIVISKS